MSKPTPDVSHGRTLLSLAPYLWPKGETELRARVVLALAALVAGKIANVIIPIAYGAAVDALTNKADAIIVIPIAMILAYGILRTMSSGFGELRDAIFAKVQARAARRIAHGVFEHLHALSMRFHLDRQTGGLSRVIERGTRGVNFVLDFMLFSIVPTIIEILMVTLILWGLFDFAIAAATFGTIVAQLIPVLPSSLPLYSAHQNHQLLFLKSDKFHRQ